MSEPEQQKITILHRSETLHGLNGWYWAEGPAPKMLYATRAEAFQAAVDAKEIDGD